MKKIICLVLVILFTASVTAAYAGGKSGCSTSAKKEGSGWTRAYKDISCWGKKSSKSAGKATKVAPKKRGTEISPKN